TRRTTIDVVRREARRRLHELIATEMNVPAGQPIVAERTPVSPQVDTLLMIRADGYYYSSVGIMDEMAGTLRSFDQQDLDRIKPFLR
ncbi:MAG: hypothetical protein KGS61_18210, partial [Verrucomicrobia bacterium]|nr:hypothetical protein [Verrucomicrobiota bacterium]